MIKLNDNYAILVDESQYILVKATGRTRKQNGKEIPQYNYLGYYSTLKTALKGYRDICIRVRLKDGMHALCEAVRIIEEEDEKIKKLFERLDGDDDA